MLQYLYGQLLDGRDIEPGEITVNVPALMFPYSDILITRTNEVQKSTKRLEIPREGFAVLKKLLCDDEVAELRRKGFDEAARARRKANRILYRILLPKYVDFSMESFRRRLSASFAIRENKGEGWLILDVSRMRWNINKLVWAARFHFLHLPFVDPCDLVKSGMRGIAFLINELSPLPPEMR